MHTTLDQLRTYIARGWHIFLVRAMGKEPLTKHGFEDASNDMAQVQQWYEKHPGCNWGLATGKRSGLFVIDIDTKEGKVGEESLAILEEQMGPLQTTLMVRTQSGGKHFYYRLPADTDVRNAANSVPGFPANAFRHIDVRGTGGYVVLPPSVGPDGSYDFYEPQLEIADPPAWMLAERQEVTKQQPWKAGDLRESTEDHPYALKALKDEIAGLAAIEQGDGRNNALFISSLKMANFVAGGGLTEDTHREAFASVIDEWDDPRKTWDTYERGLACGMLNPRNVPTKNFKTSVPSAQAEDSTPDTLGILESIRQAWDSREPLSSLDPWTFTAEDSDKQKLHAGQFGADIAEALSLKTGTDHWVYLYEDGVYKKVFNPESFADELVMTLVGPKRWDARTHNPVVKVVNTLKGVNIIDIENGHPDILNVKNGLLYWRTGELKPHTPELDTVAQLSIDWNPEAQCPYADSFIARTVPQDCIDMAWEIVGWTLCSDNSFKKLVLLKGPQNSGKSGYLELIQRLMGTNNYMTFSPHFLTTNRFAAASLYGKLANLCGDINERAIKGTDMLKQLTGQDAISAEHKGMHAFTFRSHAKMIYSGNDYPHTTDQTSSYWNRWSVLPMPNEVKETDAHNDPDYKKKLTSTSELEGALVRAVQGLKRLHDRRRWATPMSSAMAHRDFQQDTNYVLQFFEDRLELGDPEDKLSKAEVTEEWKSWVTENNIKAAWSGTEVHKKLEEALDHYTHIEMRYRTWYGIRRQKTYRDYPLAVN